MNNKWDVIIVGAGAAGLMCAIEAGKRGRKVKIIDHSNKPGKKILMSGGGRCNFTNYSIEPQKYISHNPHFCKSALSRYTQWDFIALMKKHHLAFHEKTQGQLFCDASAKDLLNILLTECQHAKVPIQLKTTLTAILKQDDESFKLITSDGNYYCRSLVIASGGLSIPTMGASPFGYKVAEHFKLKVWPTSAGLVPFTLHPADKERLAELTGVSIECEVSNARQMFKDSILFTHRGLSGPAILQLSSYWQPGEFITINLLPDHNLEAEFKLLQKQRPQLKLRNVLNPLLPKRIVPILLEETVLNKTLANFSYEQFKQVAQQLHCWQIKPNATEGYRTAEVTLGGVDCDAISSKTFECHSVAGLYFIGEVLDVTGWLGGYNFQWAWSSGWCAGQVV